MSDAQTLVLVTTSFPIRRDGSEAAGAFVADLAEALARRIHVRVVAPGTRAALENWSECIEVLRYAAPAAPLSTLKPWRPDHLSWIGRVLCGGQAATSAAVHKGAVHALALWGLPCGEWTRRACRNAGIGYSTWMLGSDVWTLGRMPVLQGMLARVIRASDRAYADGYQLADDARRIADTSVQFLPSTRVIGAGVERSKARNRPPYRLLFLGRWHANKGVDILLDALALLEANDWRRIERVEIQGGGPMEGPVRERVAALRIAGHPVEAGRFLDKAAAEQAFTRADWVLIPSRIESIPVVFSDAMKLRRPVIAMPVGDLPRLLKEREVGICSAAVDAASFAMAIRAALVEDPAAFAPSLARVASDFSLEDSIVPEILSVACRPTIEREAKE